jgi:hypothetical protein
MFWPTHNYTVHTILKCQYLTTAPYVLFNLSTSAPVIDSVSLHDKKSSDGVSVPLLRTRNLLRSADPSLAFWTHTMYATQDFMGTKTHFLQLKLPPKLVCRTD